MLKRILLKIFGLRNVLRVKAIQERYFLTGVQRREILFRKVFYSQFVKRDDLCFDVGANRGNRIPSLLAIGARVVAVEPQESCCRFLKDKFGEGIVIVQSGLGETACVRDFYIGEVSVLSSFSSEWIDSVKKSSRFPQHSWSKVVQVQITTLDKLIERYGVPHFIKIDVEGYELEVLKGLSHPIGMISFEYTVPEQTQKIVECVNEIERSNVHIECNYSIGESMVFALQTWVSPKGLVELVQTKPFWDTGFGDIYVRSVTHG